MHLWRQRFFRRLLEMPRNQKRLLMVLADLVCIPAALWTAMTLKQGTPLHASLDDSWLYLAAIMASVPVFVRLGLYRAVVRFLGTRALLTVVTGVSVSVGLLLIVNQLMLGKGVHISTFAIYWALALIYVGGSRMVARALIHVRRLGSDRVAIYGAGVAGAQVANALLGGRTYDPVAFIDDKQVACRAAASTASRFALRAICRSWCATHGVEQRAARACRRRRAGGARRSCTRSSRSAVHVQIAAATIRTSIAGNARDRRACATSTSATCSAAIRCRRNPQLFGACIRGKCVLVTGAGGSIGSELCRQIVPPRARTAGAVRDVGARALQHRARAAGHRRAASSSTSRSCRCSATPITGSACARSCTPTACRPSTTRPPTSTCRSSSTTSIEGIHNNVFSTWYTAEAALEPASRRSC